MNYDQYTEVADLSASKPYFLGTRVSGGDDFFAK
jgi:hypothetical protein